MIALGRVVVALLLSFATFMLADPVTASTPPPDEKGVAEGAHAAALATYVPSEDSAKRGALIPVTGANQASGASVGSEDGPRAGPSTVTYNYDVHVAVDLFAGQCTDPYRLLERATIHGNDFVADEMIRRVSFANDAVGLLHEECFG